MSNEEKNAENAKWLADNNVRNLLTEVVEKLVSSKPSDPRKFLIQVLSNDDPKSRFGRAKGQDLTISSFTDNLSARTPSPGIGEAAAVTAAIACASGAMAAAWTDRKQDRKSGALALAREVGTDLKEDTAKELKAIDSYTHVNQALADVWREGEHMPAEDSDKAMFNALAVSKGVIDRCHTKALKLARFAKTCNPDVQSDAKGGIHLLIGAARAAFQAALARNISDKEAEKLAKVLAELVELDNELIRDAKPHARLLNHNEQGDGDDDEDSSDEEEEEEEDEEAALAGAQKAVLELREHQEEELRKSQMMRMDSDL